MGVRQSKRSVDITEVSTKGEIEGFGNEGKVEKIIEGVEKVAANGHVDGDLVNVGESQQNGIESAQNKEAAAIASEKVPEMKDGDESGAGVVNGNVENVEINGEAEKIDEDPKKSEDKKEKKKDKKEKLVKKKFSFRNFSFSKKDKSKPPKEEKSPERMIEGETEETPNSPVQESDAVDDQMVKVIKPEESETQMNSSVEVEATKIVEEKKETEQVLVENVMEVNPKTAISSEDLPPPLPASPPPNEVIATEQDSSVTAVESKLSNVAEVACTVTNVVSEKIEAAEEVIKSAEQIAIETGKQIEEKATNLLKTVEERAGESMKTVEEFVSQKADELVEACQNTNTAEQLVQEPVHQQSLVDEAAEKVAENMLTAPIEISNLDSLATNPEDSLEKREEGGGESLADIPQDLQDVTEAAVEPTETDSLEISAIPPPPPAVEPVTGE